MMNDLCTDIGFKSLNHHGEQLCGDHVDIIEENENSTIVVLADGLGSGVKASILSTLTSKIISTMMAAGLPLEECVSTMVDTLPVCSVRGVAYSTFTIMHFIDRYRVELVQYDNPHVILLRGGKNFEYPRLELTINEKTLYKSEIRLEEGDVFIAMSDGCPHAGMGTFFSFGWERDKIAEYMERFMDFDYTAKLLSGLLLREVNRLYNGRPADDCTACVVKIGRRVPMNILFGPPRKPEDVEPMMAQFFSKEGKHIVCGGTTSTLAARFLGKPLEVSLDYENDDVPPIASIEGVDIVTEGVVTVSRVLEYASDYIGENRKYVEWNTGKDGSAIIMRLLTLEATDINFFVGKAINPAHQNPDLPINFNIKMNLVNDLSKCLRKMGKRVKVSFF